ncbi:LTA synthase family protein [Streptococcus oricebi]|uniref:Phosphoglycerol transferase n=1 Tax=Streptococcus oricebi TaxID=1547447 RepID=A0ABS5B0X5_9STRE|nr:LTA synthase family protein [Streptococcus oricebi]MBP2622483.1 phosphoglycerol transferase [Streptococcus oricebi]
MKKFLKKLSPVVLVTTFLFLLINHFLLHSLVISYQKPVENVKTFLLVSQLIYYAAILVLAFIFSYFKFHWKFLIKLLLMYIAYCCVAYFIDMTLNINNNKYKLWNFSKAGIFQEQVLFTLALVGILAVLIYYLRTKVKFLANKAPQLVFNEGIDYFFLSQILLTLILTNRNMRGVVANTELFLQLNHRITPSSSYGNNHFFLVTGIILYISFLWTGISYFLVKGARDFVKNRSSYLLAISTSLFLALVFNFSIQLSMGKGVPFLERYPILPGAMSFQIIVLFLLFLTIYLIINQFWIATNLILVIGGIFTYANSIKYNMRGEPILPSDLSWIFKADSLLGYIDSSFIWYTTVALVLLFILFFVLKRFLFVGKIITSVKMRITCLVIIAFIFSSLFGLFLDKKDGKISDNIPIVSVLNNFQDITWLGNASNARYRSLAFVWINQMTTEVMERPDNYSQKRIKEIEEKYLKLSQEINQNRSEFLNEQTVIYVLSESFSDPARVEGVELTQDPIPNIHQIKEQATSGLMKSDGYGGGTANMEFQTLTGLPFYNMSQSVSVLYTEVFPKMKYVPTISNLFKSKDRIAIHLANPSNYSRNYVYDYLKFDRFISTDTKNIDVQNEGISPSDASTYRLILDNIDKGRSQFFSVMTMQNHAPWLEDNPENLEGSADDFTSDQNSKLTFYSRLLYQTDLATKDLLENLSKIDKKITVVFYGDHLPGLYPSSAFLNNPDSQYLTDYFIWSNYERPKLDYPVVNSSDFSALVLEQTNSKVSPYYALLTEVLHKASVDKAQSEFSPEAREVAEDLKLVEYDIVSGRGYLSKNFFKLVNN